MEELRLMPGDWVNTPKGHAKVVGLLNERVYNSPPLYLPIEVEFKSGKQDGYLPSAIDGIHLTAEILTDWFGFYEHDGDFSKGLVTIETGSFGFLFSFSSEIDTVTIRVLKYVHEVQHLYEALTGEQLERK